MLQFAAFLFFPGLLSASEVLIVRTSDAEPYVKAEAAVRGPLTQEGMTVRSLLAKVVSDNGVEASVGQADIVVAIGRPAGHWLHKQLSSKIKFVYCMVSNAKEAGLLEAPICSGVSTDIPISDQFKLIGEALPKAHTVGLLYHRDADQESQAELLQAGLPPGWHMDAVAVDDFPSIAAAIDALVNRSVDIIWTTADQKLYDTATVRALLLAALRHKTPVWGFSPAFVRAGALLGVGVDPSVQGAQAAALVMHAVSQPTALTGAILVPAQFQIAVNVIVAEQLEITVPETLLHRAEFVYRPEK